MEKKKIKIISIVTALILVFAVVASFLFSNLSWKTPEVLLPEASSDDGGEGMDDTETDPGGAVLIDVTCENVQDIIETLTRLDNYHRIVNIETYWDDDQSISTVESWTRGDYTLQEIRQTEGGVLKYVITGGGKAFIWYEDDDSYCEKNIGEFTSDDVQMIPTYEDVLALDSESITDADYTDVGGENCIYVETGENELGYTERYWVSVDTGLLVASETLKDGEVIYKMFTESTEMTVPSDELFLLPDGTSALESG